MADGMRAFNRYHDIDSGFAFEWYQPNLVVLKFDEMGMSVRVHAFAIPIDRHHTRYLIAIELLDPHANAIVKEFIDPIVDDRIIIESQTGPIPPIDAEYSVPSDLATLQFRRWYHQTLGSVASINVQK